MAKKINIIANLIDKQFKKQMQDLQNGKYKVDVNVNGSGVKNASDHMRQLGNTTKNTDTIFGKLRNTISNTFSSGKIAMTSYLLVLNEINKAGKQAKETIKELDKAVTDLSIASNLSRESVSALMQDYNNLAKEMKSTTLDVSKAADDYIRAGVSMKDSQALIRDSIMLSKLGQIESNEATRDLLSTMNAYEMSIEEVERALDAMVAVDLKASTSAGEIATALRYCASNADLAGLSFNQLIAIISTIQHKTGQAAEVVGNTMNTVLSRYKNVKLGAITDDEGEDISNVETSLKQLGIQLRNSEQDFRDFEEVFNELGKNWNNYTEVQQASIAKELGGVRQMNRVIAMFEGYNKVLELTETAASSAGTSLEKFNKAYKNSLDASQNELQASFESMIMNSDMDEVYSGILKATNALVEFINETNALKGVFTGLTISMGIKGFLTLRTGINEAYISLNQFSQALKIVKQTNISTASFDRLLVLTKGLSSSQMKLILSSKNLSVIQKELLLVNAGLSREEARLKLKSQGLMAKQTGLRASTISLTNAFKGFMATLAANKIMIFTMAISGAVMAYQSYNQKLEDNRQKNIQASESTIENANRIRELYTEYMRLASIQNRTNADEDSFKKVIEDVTVALGAKAKVLEGLTAGTEAYSQALQDATKEEMKSALTDVTVARKSAQEALESDSLSKMKGSKITVDTTPTGETLSKDAERAVSIISDTLKEFESVNRTWNTLSWDIKTQDAEEIVNYYYTLLKAREQLIEQNDESLLDTDIYKELDSAINEISESVDIYTKKLYEEQKLYYIASNGIPSTTEEYKKMKDALLQTANASEAVKEKFTTLLTADFSSLATEIQETEEALSGTPNKEYLFDKLTKSKESIDKFKSSVESAYESYGKLMNPNLSSSDILTNIQAITNAVADMGESLNWEFIYSQTDSMELLGDVIERFSQKYAESVLSGAGIDIDSKFGQMLANNIVQAQKASIELENLNTNIDSLQSAYNDLTDIVDTYNSTGSVTFDQLQTLLSLEPQYLSCLIDENGQLQLNEQAMINLANQRLNDASAQAVSQAISELGTLTLQDEKVAVEENATAFSNAVGNLASYNTELSNTIAEASVGAAVIRDLNAAISGAESQGASDDQIQTVLDNLNVKLQAINSVRDKIASGSLGGAIGGSKSGGGGSSKDAWKEAYDKELKELEHLHEMQLISDEEYYNQRIALNEKYFGEASGKHEKYLDEYQKNEEDIAQGLKKMWEDYWNDYKDGLDRLSSYAEKVFQKQIDALEKQKDKSDDAYNKEIESIESAIKALEDKRDAEKEYWQDQIDAIQDEIDALQDANDERERAINLQKKMYELQRAMSQRSILQYSSEKGMHYVTNDKDITNAREEVEQAKFDITIANLQKQKEALEDKLDEITDKYDVQIEKLNLRKEIIENNMDAENKRLQEQIDLLEEQKEKWTEVAENIEFALLEREMMEKYGSDVTQKILSGDIEFLNAFISDYERATGVIQELDDATLTDIMNMVSQFGTSAENMGGISTQLADNLGTISGSADNLAESASKVNMTKVNDGLSNVSSTAQTAQEQLGTATQKFNELTNEINNYTIPPLDSTNFVASLGIDGNGGVLGDLQTFINKFKELCESIPTIWNDSLGVLVNGGGEAGGAEVRGYDSLFKPLLDAMTTTKTAIDTKLEEYKLAWQKFNTDLGTIIGVGNGSQTGAEGTDASGSKQAGGKEGSDKKEKKSEADTSSIVGTITAGGEAVIQSFDEIWIPGFETFRDNISTICEQVVQCMDEMAKKAIEAAIKTIEAVNAAAKATGGKTYKIPDSLKDWEGVTYVRPYAEGTEKAKKGLAIVAEEKPEIIVDNDGNVLLAKEPSIMNMEGGENVYNGDETEKILSAKGIRPLREEDDPILYRILQMNQDEVRSKFGIGSYMPSRPSVSDMTRDMANSNIVNNSNQSYSMNGDVHIHCPGVTKDEVAKQIGDEMTKTFFGMENKARQRVNITR